MTSAASALSFANTGLSGFTRFDQGLTGAEQQEQAGRQTAEMDEFEAQRLEDASEFGKTQAAQTDMTMRAQLQRHLGDMMAIRASANTSPDSPTGAAIAARTQGQGDQQRAIKVGNLEAQAAEDQSESGFYTSAAQQTLQAAYSNANNSLFSGFLGVGGSLLTGLKGLVGGV